MVYNVVDLIGIIICHHQSDGKKIIFPEVSKNDFRESKSNFS